MNLRNSFLFLTVLFAAATAASEPVLITSYENQQSSAQLKPVRTADGAGLSVVFTGTDDLHYYADPETAPAPELDLRVSAKAKGITFGKPVFPKPSRYYDKGLGKEIDVYVGNFEVFIPMNTDLDTGKVDVDVTVTGIACTSKLCLPPFEQVLKTTLDLSESSNWPVVTVTAPPPPAPPPGPAANYRWPFAFGLAIVAGLLLNVMPCVWPVIPIIVTRIWNQAGDSRAKSMGMGIAFSFGILLFFAAIAVLNLVLIFGFQTVFQWGDLLRNQAFLSGMTLLMVVLGLFMFGVFSIGVPSSVTAKAGQGSGYGGAVVMGFLAALLATPCSFGVLAAAVAWAQTQHWTIATITLLLIGVGMAIPYLVLTSIPGLLSGLPKPGGWMEKVKIIMGFLLLGVAIKLFTSLRGELQEATLYFALILSFCVWVWGTWVTYATPAKKKNTTRGIALLIAIVLGIWIFKPAPHNIDWQEYDGTAVQQAVKAGKPVIVKFTADWCTNCTVVKKRVFEQKDTADLIKQKGVVVFEGDTTVKEDPATVALAQVYKAAGVPFTAVHLPDGEVKRLAGIFGKDDLYEILKALPDKM